MAADPIFAAKPVIGIVQIATGDTSRTAPTSVGIVLTAGSLGTRIFRIDICGTGTTTAGVIRLWIYDGSNYRLYREILVAAITPSTSVEVWKYPIFIPEGLILPSGYSLRATTNNSETFNVVAQGGDF